MSLSISKKLISYLLIGLMFLNQGLFFVPVILAQEASPSAETPPTIAPDATPVASNSATPQPTEQPTPIPTLTLTPTLPPQQPTSVVSQFLKLGPKVKSQPENDQILVKFKNSLSLEQARTFASSRNLVFESLNRGANLGLLAVRNNKQVDQVLNQLKIDPQVLFAEPNFKRSISATTPGGGGGGGGGNPGIETGDPLSGDLYGLNKINVVGAWSVTEGTPSAIVAVVDTGVDYNHPDLAPNMWDGSSCKDPQGVTIVGGCLHGFDFADGDNDPLPVYSQVAFHGTHVAGTIAAAKNTIGVVGIAPKVKIMALRFGFDVASEVQAIDFARVNGARVINASYGGSQYSQAEREAIDRFRQAGGVFVASAGNHSSDLDTNDVYPAKYPLENLISVAATDSDDHLAYFSNYGLQGVDLAAPGQAIESTVPSFVSRSMLYQSFDQLATGSATPAGWNMSPGGHWQVAQTGDPWGGIWYADNQLPYSDSANSTVSSPAVDLTNSSGANLSFWVSCDTDYFNQTWTTGWKDYLALEVSTDGNQFVEISKWDEFGLDDDSDEANNTTPPARFFNIPLANSFLSNNFQFRFRWVTDSSNNNYQGCFVDSIDLSKTSYDPTADYTNAYSFVSGTSMAAPHVSGTAALLFSQNPSLSTSQVKNILLATGDPLPQVSERAKILSGKRLNANNALHSLTDPEIVGLLNDPSPTKSKTWNWSAVPIGSTFRYTIDQSVSKTFDFNDSYGATASATLSGVNGTYYIHVQAQSPVGVESSVVSVSVIMDNTAPNAPSLPSISSPISAPITPASISSPLSYASNSPVQFFEWSAVVDQVSGVAEYFWQIVNGVTGEILDSGGTIYQSILYFFSDGIWNFLVSAEDNAGNQGASLGISVTVDTASPSATITSPTNGSSFNHPPVFTALASDPSGVESVSFEYRNHLDQSPQGGGGAPDGQWLVLNSDSEAPYQADWTGAILNDNQSYDLQIEVVDKAGNVSTFGGVSFTFDSIIPTAPDISSPSATLVINADSINISGLVEAGTLVKVYRSGSVVGSQQLEPLGLSPQGGGTPVVPFLVNVPLLQNSINNFTVTSTDRAGNESGPSVVPTITEDSNAASIISYTLDKTKISTQVSRGINDTASFDLNFSEAVLADFDILDALGNKVKDIYAATVTNPQAKIWDGKNNSGNFVPDGVYTIRISITDVAGNNLTDTSKTITVDNDTLTLNPIGGKTINEGVNLNFTASASDEEASIITYSATNLPLGASINSSTGVFNWTPTEFQGPGSYLSTIQARSVGGIRSENINLNVDEVNVAPIAADKVGSGNQGQPITVTLSASDPDFPANTLSFSILTPPASGSATVTGNVLTYTSNNNFSGTDILTYQVNDGNLVDTATVTFTVTNPHLMDLTNPTTQLSEDQNQILITDLGGSNQATINIPSDVDNPILDFTALDNLVGLDRVVTLVDNLTINSTTNYGEVVLNLPLGLTITGLAGNWDGKFNAPSDELFNFSLPLQSNQSVSNLEVIEVGAGNVPLTLSSAARLKIVGRAGGIAGYLQNGTFTEITRICSLDDQATMDLELPAGGDCKMDLGADLVIWTKHFTQFVAYNVVTSNSSSSSSSNSNDRGPASAPQCNDAKPGAAPRLLSATAGPNSVTLTWSKAADPVTYYLITYGDGPGKQQYGNPNVGGKETTSYTISGLSGNTSYYFRVRAGNSCMPGDFSNEVSIKVGGKVVVGPAAGFQAGVLGAKAPKPKVEPTSESDQPQILGEEKENQLPSNDDELSIQTDQSVKSSGFFGSVGNFLGSVLHFFTGFFR